MNHPTAWAPPCLPLLQRAPCWQSLAAWQPRICVAGSVTQPSSMLRRWLLLPLAAPLLARADDKPYGEGPIIGVDLGTTYSCVAIYKAGSVEIIVNDQGNRVTPSYVAFTETERLVGDAAKTQAALNPENTVYDTKRLIGRKFTDASVQEDMKMCLAALCTQRAPSRAQPKESRPTVPQRVRTVRPHSVPRTP